MTIAEVKAFVAEMDPELAAEDEESDVHMAAVVVASCLMVRVDVDALCSYTGYDKPLIEYLVEKLKKNDLVGGDLLVVDWIGEDSVNAMSFLTTVLCATGMIEITATGK